MRKHSSRTALRLPDEQKERIAALIRDGKYQNISQVIRQALKEFLAKE